MKGTPLHDASIVGDTVGDPFKDTSSVAMNPVIKFTTLFGLLAVELGVYIGTGATLTLGLAAVFFVVSMCLRVSLVLRDAHRELRTGWRPTQPLTEGFSATKLNPLCLTASFRDVVCWEPDSGFRCLIERRGLSCLVSESKGCPE